MRLDKFLSETTDLTRSQASKALKQGVVEVNGEVVKSGAMHIEVGTDQITINGIELVGQTGPRYFMLHKPAGYVCANEDGEHPIVFDLMIDEPNVQKLHTVGRLDLDTTGILLITDDGKWSHTITSPKHHKDKTYRAWLAEPLVEKAEAKLEKGIMLEEEKNRTKPAVLQRINDQEVLLTISEGRYHQVKRMFAALGNRVVQLHRESIGGIMLDENLAEGEYRPLTDEEIAILGATKGQK